MPSRSCFIKENIFWEFINSSCDEQYLFCPPLTPILSNFKYIQENIDGKKKELSEQILSLTNRLFSAREKYLEDRLDFEDYQIIKNESRKKLMSLKWNSESKAIT